MLKNNKAPRYLGPLVFQTEMQMDVGRLTRLTMPLPPVITFFTNVTMFSTFRLLPIATTERIEPPAMIHP